MVVMMLLFLTAKDTVDEARDTFLFLLFGFTVIASTIAVFAVAIAIGIAIAVAVTITAVAVAVALARLDAVDDDGSFEAAIFTS